jgi:hypothetical protein
MPLLILLLALPVLAQNPAPQWLDESWRTSRYPNTEWYTGFATDRIAKGQPDSKAYEAVEKNAQAKLSESIVVTVQGSSALQTSSKQTQTGETISRDYDQNIKTASTAVLAKVEVKSHYDKKSGNIYAFAAVRKKDLAAFYRSSINTLLAFAEKEFAIAEQQANQGKKKSALDKIRATEDTLKSVGYWGALLQMVESDNSYLEREKANKQKAGDLKMQLQNGTSVYLNISGDDNLESLGAEMQEKGCNCSIAEKEEDADYSVAIKSKLSNCTESGNGLVFCYATATVVVNSLKQGKLASVKIPEAKGGWPNNNKDKATAEAFKKLTSSLAEKINQTINQ